MSQTSEIYVGFCHRRPTNDPLHWILIVRPQGSQRCTWYHVEGGATQGYSLKIQANKRMDSFGVASKQFIGRIDEKDIGKLRASAQSISMQRCQRWTVEVLGSLERKGLVPGGTTNRFAAQVEPAPAARTSGSSKSGGKSDSKSGRSSGNSSRRW